MSDTLILTLYNQRTTFRQHAQLSDTRDIMLIALGGGV